VEVLKLSSSSSRKLSLHLIVPAVSFSLHNVDMVFFVWELVNRMKCMIEDILATATAADRENYWILFRALGLHKRRGIRGFVVDLAPYTRNQCFRLPGNCKRGKRNALSKTLFMAEGQDANFRTLFTDFNEWRSYIVKQCSTSRALTISPGKYTFLFSM
jgi:hypothetical protein